MLYRVIKQFNDLSGIKMPGESIELDNDRAAKLRKNRLIGGLYTEKIEKVEEKVNEEVVKETDEETAEDVAEEKVEETAEEVVEEKEIKKKVK